MAPHTSVIGSGLALAFALAASLFPTQASATPWTVTTTGIIDAGHDYSGAFGAPTSNLSGLPYTLSITLDPSQFESQSGGLAFLNDAGTNPMSVSVTASVKGVYRTFNENLDSNPNGGATLFTYLSQLGYGLDDINQFQEGTSADGTYLYALNYIYSLSDVLGLQNSYTQDWSHTVQAGDNAGNLFVLSGPDGDVFLDGYVSTISINNVPEPGSLALVCVALMGLVGVQCKRSQKQ